MKYSGEAGFAVALIALVVGLCFVSFAHELL
jgi:hypothetical protein